MALTHSPAQVELGSAAADFDLPATDGSRWNLSRARGPAGLLVAFICNHCPYVLAIKDRLGSDCRQLQALGYGVVAISSNDARRYPADSFEAMGKLAKHLPKLLEDPESRELVTREVTGTIQETMGDVMVAAKAKLKEKARSNFSAILAGSTATASLGPLAGVMAAGAVKSGMLDNMVEKLIDNMADELRKDGGVDGAAKGIVKALPERAEQILADEGLRGKLTELFEGMASDLVNAVDVAGLVEQELLGRDESDLESLIDRVAANELTFIQVAGGGLGMIAGLSWLWPWLLLPIGGVFLLMVQVARIAEKKHAEKRRIEREGEKFADAVVQPAEDQPELPAPQDKPEQLPAPEEEAVTASTDKVD